MLKEVESVKKPFNFCMDKLEIKESVHMNLSLHQDLHHSTINIFLLRFLSIYRPNHMKQ